MSYNDPSHIDPAAAPGPRTPPLPRGAGQRRRSTHHVLERLGAEHLVAVVGLAGGDEHDDRLLAHARRVLVDRLLQQGVATRSGEVSGPAGARFPRPVTRSGRDFWARRSAVSRADLKMVRLEHETDIYEK